MMKTGVLVVDVQPSFDPPDWLVARAQALADRFVSAATVERHDEAATPFMRQLNWAPAADDETLVRVGRVFIKHGYRPPEAVIDHFRAAACERVLVCGVQAETCVLAAGFALFDAGLHPTLVADAVAGSSLDRTGRLGVDLWRHHFGAVIARGDEA